MIFDRNQEDVNAAIRIINEKVRLNPVTMKPENLEPLTEAEIETLERGTLTLNTLNRIEMNQDALKRIFNKMGYWDVSITTNQWERTQVFDKTELERLFENTQILKKGFFVYNNTPVLLPALYHWENINSLEKILYDLEFMANDVVNNYKECGNFECGEE